MLSFCASKLFSPLSYMAKLYSVNSLDEKYSKVTIEAQESKDLMSLQEEFVKVVLSPRKDASDYWEFWHSSLGLIQKITFIGIIIVGYYNIDGAKFLKSKKVIILSSKFQFSIGLFPVITIGKEVVKSISIYKKKQYSEAQTRKQFFLEVRLANVEKQLHA